MDTRIIKCYNNIWYDYECGFCSGCLWLVFLSHFPIYSYNRVIEIIDINTIINRNSKLSLEIGLNLLNTHCKIEFKAKLIVFGSINVLMFNWSIYNTLINYCDCAMTVTLVHNENWSWYIQFKVDCFSIQMVFDWL